MNISFRLLISMLAVGLLTSIILWVLEVISIYHNELSVLDKINLALSNEKNTPNLIWLWIKYITLCLGPAYIAIFVLTELTGSNSQDDFLRGSKLVLSKDLDNKTRQKYKDISSKKQIEIGGIAVPYECESSHFLLVGSTGAGKTVAIIEMLSAVFERNDRSIIIDPDGEIYAKFGRSNDVLLNPFDRRTENWCCFNEIRKPYDFDTVSKSMIPDSADTNTQQWHGYAQQLLSAVLKEQSLQGIFGHQNLNFWCTQAPVEELKNHLVGSNLSGMFDSDSSKALSSTRFILSSKLSPLQYLNGGDFSLRNWLDSGKGNLYITWRQDMLSSLEPLIGSWVDILISHILTLSSKNPRPLWLFLDELSSLGKLNSIVQGLTTGRKHGLRVVGCLQSTAQLDLIYGDKAAITLRSCFRNLIALGGSNIDPDTARIIADGLGQAEIDRNIVSTSKSKSEEAKTETKSVQRETKNIVLPAELMQLATLSGYLALAGDFPIAKFQLKYVEHPARNPAFVERA